jgi:dipeptidyl aminopeptidase/acylaminoacyl peptidase
MIFNGLLYRHWNSYKQDKRSHLLIIPAEGGPSRGLTPGDHDAPVFSLGGQDNYAFSPDGKEIGYTSNHDLVEATSTNNDLWIVSVKGGKAKNITGENTASDSTPLYSPDGNYIAYRAQARPGYESDRFRLLVYDRKTETIANLTESFDRSVGDFVWAPDSKAIYFTAENKGQAPIYAVDVAQAMGAGRRRQPLAQTRILLTGFNAELGITPDGRTLLFSRMSASEPGEIYASDVSGPGCPAMTGEVDSGEEKCSLNTHRVITQVNQPLLSQTSMSKIESFWFEGANADKVEGFVIRPPSFDRGKKYPVKFLIHGGPQSAWGDDWSYRWNSELFAANGYVVVMINFHGSTGYGQKFIDAIRGDWGGAPFEDLMKGLDYAEQRYPFIDKDRECALGASYGGYMANWILGHSHRFKCIVSHDGMFNTTSAWGTTEELWFNEWEFRGTPYDNRALYDQWSPHLSATKFTTPTLVIHGQLDYRLDVSEGFQLFTTLQRLGVPSKMLYFPDEGHWVLKPQNSQLWYQTVNDWVDQWVRR